MRLTRKSAFFSSLAVSGALAVGCLLLPPLLKQLAIQKITEATGRKAEIARLSINPFTLSVGISGLRLSEKGSGATFLRFSSAQISLSPLSLPRRALIITKLQIASPYLHLVRVAPNSFNFSDLLAGKKPKKGSAMPYSLNNITVTNGSLDFRDQALSPEKTHRVTGITLSLPFFSTIPYLADRYVSPDFSAVVNGSPVVINGRLKPLTRAVEASFDLKVRQLDLPFYLGYLPFPLPVRVDSGRLTTSLLLGFRVADKSGPETTLTGSIDLDRVALREPGGAPLATLRRARLKIRSMALAARQLDLSSLDLDGLELFAARDGAGTWNFQKLAAGNRPEPAAVRQQRPGVPLALKLSKLSLKGGKLHLLDSTPKGGFRTDLSDIDLSLAEFSTAPGHRAPFTLRLASSRGESAALKGDFIVEPLQVRMSLALAGIPLKEYYPYLSEILAAPVSGTLGVFSELLYTPLQGLLLERTTLRGENLAAPFGRGEGFHLKELLASGIRVDLKRRKAGVGNLELRGGNLLLSRGKNGAFSPERLLRPHRAPTAAHAKVQGRSSTGGRQAAAVPFSYRIERVAGSDLGIRFTDRTREEAPHFALSRMKFSLAGIAGPKQGPIPFTLASGYGTKGRISASGAIDPAPLRLKGNLELHGIPLRDFDAYIPEDTTVFLADGTLDTKLSLNLQKTASGFQGSFGGSLGVRSFYCQDAALEEDLLKWDSLQMEKISGTLAPLTLAISNVSLSNFYTRVIVEKDGTLNLQHLVRTKAAALSETPDAAAKKPAPGPQNAIRIDSVTIQGGTLALSDRHLKTPFDTTFYNLGGRVSGLTSEADRTADVDLRGNLENHSPLSITGVINPLRGDLLLALKISFTDIDLSPLTPYSNTYLGYNVDKGKLSLDLVYRIDKKALTSSNKLFIDQFSFGKQVKSEKATKLPVRLAVALLKDSRGEIHLDLPVAGQTNDPKFSVWGVVAQMLKNLLVKAATSPFALLGSLIGGGEDFGAVHFAPGSARISKEQEGKLLKLSRALQDRPTLNLEISGFVDREKDAEGYRDDMLLKKLKGEKFRTLAKEGKSRQGQTRENTELLPQEYPIYLKAVYAREKFPKPCNALGITKDLPDAEMKKLIITHTVVGNNELQALARERVEVVRAFLQKNGKLPPERLFEKNADIFRPSSGEGTSGSRVEFGANVK